MLKCKITRAHSCWPGAGAGAQKLPKTIGGVAAMLHAG